MVDLSALIFVALAVVWAAYLIPMALKHHDEANRSRHVEGFSQRMRVLARRDAVDRRTAKLVTPGAPAVEAEAEPSVGRLARLRRRPAVKAAPAPQAEAPASLTPAQVKARRAAAKRATARRRNVLAGLLVANLVVVAVAAFGVVSWWVEAVPAGLLIAWLVACRVMVKGERAALSGPIARMPQETPTPAQEPASAPAHPADDAVGEASAEVAEDAQDDAAATIDPLQDTSAGIAAIVDPSMWDPVSVPLPTYVNKPAAARRTVRTIDLDDSGVWTSGRTDADAQIAREADEAQRASRQAQRDGDDHRAVGS